MPHQCTNCGRTFPDGSKEMLSGCPDCGGNKFQFEPAGRSAESAPDSPNNPEPPDSPSSVANTVSQATRTVRDWVSSDDSPSADTGADGTGARSPASDTAQSPSASDRRPEQSADTRHSDTQSPSSAGSEAGSNKSTPNETRPDLGEDGSTEWPDHGFEDPYRDRSAPPESESKEWPDVGQRPDQPTESDRDDTSGERRRSPVDTSEDTAQASARSDVVSPDELPDDPPTESADNGKPSNNHSGSAKQRPPDASEGRVASTPNDDDNPDLEALRAELNEQFESIKIVRPGEYELNLMELYDREEYIVSLMEDGRYAIEVPDAWRGDEDR
ncbi:OapC/ArvC family zinc-ribbon domain-containing protein [Natranaeroarchaeum aerophilus]|uniref:Origin-associated protein OapC n=1 Tax=Natranaeroarchaeum aerophilus TaxID=2917711 RepID=A0AAE3FM32_9EURY|nr:Zn-ribbon containing protein [Natranaeroarchaeum aerophilus]MCL9812237.1 hypothetical protein [Natranaeroarchaeum aerophilus]